MYIYTKYTNFYIKYKFATGKKIFFSFRNNYIFFFILIDSSHHFVYKKYWGKIIEKWMFYEFYNLYQIKVYKKYHKLKKKYLIKFNFRPFYPYNFLLRILKNRFIKKRWFYFFKNWFLSFIWFWKILKI